MPDRFQKVLKDKPFSAFDNETLRDPKLSLKARGLLVTCLSLPPDWRFSIRGLTGFCRDGRDAVDSALQELEAAGYLRRSKIPGHTEDGKFSGTEYTFFEVPEQPRPDFPDTVKPDTVKPDTENPPQQKKEEQKKEITNPPIAPREGRRKRAKLVCEWEPEAFERFWKLYPRGEDKDKARYEWDALQPDHALMQIMSAALKRQIQTDEWQRGVGIPYACRWLSNHRWEAAEKLSPQIQQAGRVLSPEVAEW